LEFEANQGQTSRDVAYLARASNYQVFLTVSEAVLKHADGQTLRIRPKNARPAPATGESRLPGVSNYYYGERSGGWISGVPHFARVQYRDIYPGIDLVYYGNERQLEYDFVIKPGADPGRIRIAFDGAGSLKLDAGGNLIAGAFTQHKPVIYQMVEGTARPVEGSYVLRGREASFRIGAYDRSQPLIIDPVVSVSTYLGGNSHDAANEAAVHSSGSLYLTGWTLSTNFPAVSAAQPGLSGGLDAFVTRINSTGTGIVYSTYLGGSGQGDAGNAIAVDAEGNAYVGGTTDSTGAATVHFPVNVASPYPNSNSGDDGFVTKLGPSGNLIWSVLVGGSAADQVDGIGVDTNGHVFICGRTSSADLASTPSPTPANGFVSRLANNGTTRVFDTIIGGSGFDHIYALHLGANGVTTVSGYTNSTDLATTAGRIGAATGLWDVIIAQLNGAGAVTSSVRVSGSGDDVGTAVTVDGAGNVIVGGWTASADFPMQGAFQGTYGGGEFDAFLMKLNPQLTAMQFATFLGGLAREQVTGVAVDSANNIYASGSTFSQNFPVVGSSPAFAGGSDTFVSQFRPNGTPVYLQLYGGSSFESANDLRIDANRRLYIVGQTASTNLPVTLALQPNPGGATDATVTVFRQCGIQFPATSAHTVAGGPASLALYGEAGCPWVVESLPPWITPAANAGTGTTNLAFTVQPNPNPVSRTATLVVEGQTQTITQAGTSTCAQPSVTAIDVPATAQTGSFLLAAPPGCAWEAISTGSWAQLFPLNGVGPATVSYTAFSNFATVQRAAKLTFGGREVDIRQAAATGSVNARLVRLAYFHFLGREPSQAEIDFQINSALNQGVSPAAFLESFFGASEFGSRGRFVAGLYVGLLDRDAEFGGYRFQTDALTRGIVNQDQLVSNFLNSGEYSLRFGSPDNSEFVRLLYRYVLLREATPAEVNFHVGSLQTSTRSQVATSFLNSAEFRQGTGPRLSAFLLYATLVLRDGTPGELAEIRTRIAGGVPLRTLLLEIISGPEFTSVLN
jgi:hypothetical protein